MKKLFSVIMLMLALNFLAAAGGIGWLFKTGKLDKEKIAAIKLIVFPPADASATTQPAAAPDASTQPTLSLDELLAHQANHSAGEQLEFLERTFDERMAELDRRQRELGDLKRQVDLAQEKLAEDRATYDKDSKALAEQEQQAAKLDADKGFQDSLALYSALPATKVKDLFLSLDDAAVAQYLEAMTPRTAAKIMKEFKTPEETDRLQKILQQMRQEASAEK